MRSSRRNDPPEGPAGILFELIHNRFPRGGGYWLTAFLFGGIFPTLVALLIVLPLKGRPIGGAWQPALLITAFLMGRWHRLVPEGLIGCAHHCTRGDCLNSASPPTKSA